MSRPLNRIPGRKKTSTTKTWPSQRCISPTKRKSNTPKQNRRRAARTAFMPAPAAFFLCMNNPDILSGTPRRDPPKVFFANYYLRAIPHNSKCRYGERGAADAKPKAQIILDAAKVSAASGGNSEPKQGQRSQSARAFAPEARCGYRNPTLSSILATQMPCRSRRSGA